MASTIFHVPAKEILEGYKADDFRLTAMRKSGKDAVLGLGYQMGGPKFYEQNHASDPTLTPEFSKEIVGLYRERFYKVPQFWDNINEAAIEAMSNGGRPVAVCGNSAIRFKKGEYWLQCKLPSGRSIYYPGAELGMQETPWGELKEQLKYKTLDHRNQWVNTSTYGGKLTENVDQAVSRDIMANGLLRVEAAGYPPVMSVHDEGVSEVPDDHAGTVKEYEDLLCVLPDWASGLPLKASGWEGKRYRK
jgi:DNA polymerase